MTSANPLVSVIMPTFRRPALLRRSVMSVLAQTYANLELIVVDDCSPDETPQVMAGFGDARVRYIRLASNQRAARARNIGIEAARGELIAFQDDDDLWLIEKLEKQVAHLLAAPPEVGLSIAAYLRYFDDHVEYVGGAERFAGMDFRRGPLAGFALIATPGWLVRRECLLEAGGFDPGLRSWDDWELGYRLSKVCRFSHVEQPLYVQDRAAGGAMWKLQSVYAADLRIILDKHGADWRDQPEVLARFQALAGRFEAQYGAPVEARRWLRQSLALRPFQPRAWLLYLLSLVGNAGIGAAAQLLRRLRGTGR
ncbi:MAG TPA: glycosyltransferase family 2 protein [Solimonas sp.]|nr:glycosyltransferase family 2 protein [Solimonas sp.]